MNHAENTSDRLQPDVARIYRRARSADISRAFESEDAPRTDAIQLAVLFGTASPEVGRVPTLRPSEPFLHDRPAPRLSPLGRHSSSRRGPLQPFAARSSADAELSRARIAAAQNRIVGGNRAIEELDHAECVSRETIGAHASVWAQSFRHEYDETINGSENEVTRLHERFQQQAIGSLIVLDRLLKSKVSPAILARNIEELQRQLRHDGEVLRTESVAHESTPEYLGVVQRYVRPTEVELSARGYHLAYSHAPRLTP